MIYGIQILILGFYPIIAYTVGYAVGYAVGYPLKKMVGMNSDKVIYSLTSISYNKNDQCKKWSLCR
jgi:hypothetical protein